MKVLNPLISILSRRELEEAVKIAMNTEGNAVNELVASFVVNCTVQKFPQIDPDYTGRFGSIQANKVMDKVESTELPVFKVMVTQSNLYQAVVAVKEVLGITSAEAKLMVTTSPCIVRPKSTTDYAALKKRLGEVGVKYSEYLEKVK